MMSNELNWMIPTFSSVIFRMDPMLKSNSTVFLELFQGNLLKVIHNCLGVAWSVVQGTLSFLDNNLYLYQILIHREFQNFV